MCNCRSTHNSIYDSMRDSFELRARQTRKRKRTNIHGPRNRAFPNKAHRKRAVAIFGSNQDPLSAFQHYSERPWRTLVTDSSPLEGEAVALALRGRSSLHQLLHLGSYSSCLKVPAADLMGRCIHYSSLESLILTAVNRRVAIEEVRPQKVSRRRPSALLPSATTLRS